MTSTTVARARSAQAHTATATCAPVETLAKPRAVFAGTITHPEVRLTFARGATHAASGATLMEWVRKAPRRHWDSEAREWVITAFGGAGFDPKARTAVDATKISLRNPIAVLTKAGFGGRFEAGLREPEESPAEAAARLARPLCVVDPASETGSQILIYPRFAGWDVVSALFPAAKWYPEGGPERLGAFTCPVGEILDEQGVPWPQIEVDRSLVERARASRATSRALASRGEDQRALAARAAKMVGTDPGAEEVAAALEALVGKIPGWFGMDPRGYQRLGALAACAGHSFIADDMGLGKTAQGLAACAIRNSRRILIIAPPVAISGWVRETERTRLAAADPDSEQACSAALPRDGFPQGLPPERAGMKVVAFVAGRKEPALPDPEVGGVVVVSDSLLAARGHLVEQLVRWGPDALVYDEIHRARSWTGVRSVAARTVADSLRAGALRIGLTGTPLFNSPDELGSMLAITGHLDPIFGGYRTLTSTFCRKNAYKKFVAVKKMLPRLRELLEANVWVRRVKSQALPELPAAPEPAAMLVDIEMKDYRAAYAEVRLKIDEWIDGFLEARGRYPDDKEIKEYAQGAIGLVSPLRLAAGLAKVASATELLNDWHQAERERADAGEDAQPLLLWAHHKEVVEALRAKAVACFGADRVEVIDGATPALRRGEVEQKFQAGQTSVLVASIAAAGVAITLTRGSEQLWVEGTWSVPEFQQAVDRQHRFGQTNGVNVRVMIAAGTIDGHIQRVLERKRSMISQVADGGGAVAALDAQALKDADGPADVVIELVHEAIAARLETSRSRRRAA